VTATDTSSITAHTTDNDDRTAIINKLKAGMYHILYSIVGFSRSFVRLFVLLCYAENDDLKEQIANLKAEQ
jgi:hypothetical protein